MRLVDDVEDDLVIVDLSRIITPTSALPYTRADEGQGTHEDRGEVLPPCNVGCRSVYGSFLGCFGGAVRTGSETGW